MTGVVAILILLGIVSLGGGLGFWLARARLWGVFLALAMVLGLGAAGLLTLAQMRGGLSGMNLSVSVAAFGLPLALGLGIGALIGGLRNRKKQP